MVLKLYSVLAKINRIVNISIIISLLTWKLISNLSTTTVLRSLLQLLLITYYVFTLYFAWRGHYWDHSDNKSNCMITRGNWRTFGKGPEATKRNSLCQTCLKSTGFKLTIPNFDYFNNQRQKLIRSPKSRSTQIYLRDVSDGFSYIVHVISFFTLTSFSDVPLLVQPFLKHFWYISRNWQKVK